MAIIIGILSQVFIHQRATSFTDIGDINEAITGTVGGFTLRGATWPIGGYISSVSISAEDECFFPVANAPTPLLPPTADPPFPPVWPYLFSTNDIYGRDNLSLNLKMVRANTFSFDAAVILNGAPVDITGGTLSFTAKWSVLDLQANAVITLTSSSGILVTDAALGEFTVTIPHSATLSLPFHEVNLPYDIQLLDSLGHYYTVLLGNLKVVPNITS